MSTRFIVTLAAPNEADGLRALRALLKLALRRFGLRCIAVRSDDNHHPEAALSRLASSRRARP